MIGNNCLISVDGTDFARASLGYQSKTTKLLQIYKENGLLIPSRCVPEN